jgi:hypothetical protein
MFVIPVETRKNESVGSPKKEASMKKLLVVLSIVAVLLTPAGAWAGGYGHRHHHHHKHHHAEYLALGILGGVLGGIALGHAISGHSHYVSPPPPVYVPAGVYYGPVYPVHRHHRYCHH